jgi:hypothetical protein
MDVTKLTQLLSPSFQGFGVTLWISKLTQLWHWSADLSSLTYHLQVHQKFVSGATCNQSRYTMCRCRAVKIHRWEYNLDTGVLKIIEQYVVVINSRHTSCNPKGNSVFPDYSTVIPSAPWLVPCTLRYSLCSCRRFQVLSGLSSAPSGSPRLVISTPSHFQILPETSTHCTAREEIRNHHAKLGYGRVLGTWQCSIPKMASKTPGCAGTNTITMSCESNQAGHISDFLYLYLSFISYPSASFIAPACPQNQGHHTTQSNVIHLNLSLL